MQFVVVLSALAGLALANPVVNMNALEGSKVSADAPSRILAAKADSCCPPPPHKREEADASSGEPIVIVGPGGLPIIIPPGQ
ncbi:hypothetical protein E4U55_005329 [Claviceps digitariae]|nr:hypothetical protein E4U55_005329 [Claviceps digitariae]